MKKDEDYELLYEGSLKKEKDVKVTLVLPDEYEDPPETNTTVEQIFFHITVTFDLFVGNIFLNLIACFFTGCVSQHACAYLQEFFSCRSES